MGINNVKQVKIGIGHGVLAGATWGVDTVLVGLFMAMSPFVDTAGAIALAPFVSTFMHDFFSAIWATIYMIFKKQFKNVLKAARTKGGMFIMLGALLGGPIGMTCYMASINYIGGAYTASITAVFPGISAILAYVILKEKMNARVWIGIILSVLGVFVLGYSPAQLNAEGSKFLLGILLALGTAFAWAAEGIICAFSMKYTEIDPEHSINIRQATSALFYGFAIMPFIGGYGLASSVVVSPVGMIIAFTAIFGTWSYFEYYKAINIIGAARSTALNITYGVWAIIIQFAFLHITVSPQLIIGALVVILGSVLVSGNPKELVDLSTDVA